MCGCVSSARRSRVHRPTARRPRPRRKRETSKVLKVEAANQNFAPVLVLLALIIAYLYLHFTGSSGLSRLYLAAGLTLVAVVLLLPTIDNQLPDQLKQYLPGTKIQLGLDLQGGTHLLMAVKLDEAVKTQLKRRGDDLKKELKDNKIDADITQNPDTGALVVALKGNA